MNFEDDLFGGIYNFKFSGLPGFLCTLGNGGGDYAEGKRKLDIYGPLGLKKFVQTSLLLAQSPLPYGCEFHELLPTEDQFVNQDQALLSQSLVNESSTPENLIKVSEEANIWELAATKTATVIAGPIKHRVPSYGFVIQEKDTPGKHHSIRIPYCI